MRCLPLPKDSECLGCRQWDQFIPIMEEVEHQTDDGSNPGVDVEGRTSRSRPTTGPQPGVDVEGRTFRSRPTTGPQPGVDVEDPSLALT